MWPRRGRTNIFLGHLNVLSSNEIACSFTSSRTIEILLLEGSIVSLEALGRDVIVSFVNTGHFVQLSKERLCSTRSLDGESQAKGGDEEEIRLK